MGAAKGSITRPGNWKELPYYAPYYLNAVAPDRLQIWVKPRYWFAAATAFLAVGWLVPSFGSYDTFDAMVGPVISVFAGANAKSKITDAYNLRFLILVPFGFILGAIIFNYKRRGLIEIGPEGIWIVDDPRFSPGGARLIERADIMGFEDSDLYSNMGKFSRVRSGTELKVVMQPGKGADIPLLKIWGVDALNKADYHKLREAIETAFERGKKSKRPGKSGEPFATLVPGPTAEELALAGERRASYLRWEKICLVLSLVLWAGHILYSSFVPLGYRLDRHWWIYAIAIVALLMQISWFFRMWRQPTKWRALLLMPVLVAAAISPIYLSYHFRDGQMRQGISLYATVTDRCAPSSKPRYHCEIGFRYEYGGKTFAGKGMSGGLPEPGDRVKVQVSRAYPSMHELDSSYWQPLKKSKKLNRG